MLLEIKYENYKSTEKDQFLIGSAKLKTASIPILYDKEEKRGYRLCDLPFLAIYDGFYYEHNLKKNDEIFVSPWNVTSEPKYDLPIECELALEAIEHIEYTPEPDFYELYEEELDL